MKHGLPTPFMPVAELTRAEDQFQVAAAERVSIESVQERVRSLLVGSIVGFAIDNDLKVLGISRNDLMVRDVQLHFDAEKCSEPDLSSSELPALSDSCRIHSLAKCVLGRGSSQCPG